MDTIRILIVDDHPIFRRGLCAGLTTEPDIKVIGEAGSGEEAMELARDLMPDVILMDLRLPGMNGTDAIRQIRTITPHIAILVITMLDDDSVFATMQAGALGYLLKEADANEIVQAIRTVNGGTPIFSPKIAKRITAYFQAPKSNAVRQLAPDLTAREYEILTLIAQGLTNAAILEKLCAISHEITPKTLRNHISNIYSKLQVSDRTEAILRVREVGLG